MCLFQSGVGVAIIGGFSHRSSPGDCRGLSDRNALRFVAAACSKHDPIFKPNTTQVSNGEQNETDDSNKKIKI